MQAKTNGDVKFAILSRMAELDYIAESLRELAIPIESVVEDPQNPRTHPGNNIATIRASIRAKGQDQPIVVRAEDMMISKGHGRLTAMKELGHTHIAAVVIEESRISALERGIADNRSSDQAGTDDAALAAIFRELDDSFSEIIGYTDEEVATFLTNANQAADQAAREAEAAINAANSLDSSSTVQADAGLPDNVDEIPDLPAEPVTKLGERVQLGPHELICGDCLVVMRGLPDNSIDAVVTDPPYGLGFMGKEWDCTVPGKAWAIECLRVLKPGGHLIAASSTRTYHRLTCAVEDVGFEIRDMIDWIQYQGFPKSLDVSKAIDAAAGAEREVIGVRTTGIGTGGGSTPIMGDSENKDITAPATPEAKQWNGWGTGLKPSVEPFVLARKPLSEKTVAANVLKWGTGALNIDACRYAENDKAWPGPQEYKAKLWDAPRNMGYGTGTNTYVTTQHVHPLGRWPANIYHCPKPARSEKEAGCAELPAQDKAQLAGATNPNDPVSERFVTKDTTNIHPTVKPAKLMRWLLKLVTPPGGHVLEPFAGSGTTLVAAKGLDMRVTGIELDPAYCDIAQARIRATILE